MKLYENKQEERIEEKLEEEYKKEQKKQLLLDSKRFVKKKLENKDRNKFMSSNSALLKMINKFGLLKNDGGNEEKKVISHRIYNRNRENCVESGMLLEANKVKLIISKKIFKDKYSSKLPAPEMSNE